MPANPDFSKTKLLIFCDFLKLACRSSRVVGKLPTTLPLRRHRASHRPSVGKSRLTGSPVTLYLSVNRDC